MAEFCLECWNKLNKTNDSKRKYVFSRELEICEGCGEWKKVIIAERKYYYRRRFKVVRYIYIVLYTIWRILILPYLIYKDYKSKKL